MNYAYLFAGLAAGLFISWTILLIIIFLKKTVTKEDIDRAAIPNELLSERNQIGEREARALTGINASLALIAENGLTGRRPLIASDALSDMEVIRTIATKPHHPNALEAIKAIAQKRINIATGKENEQ